MSYYDNWKTGHYDDSEPDRYCDCCEDKDEKLDKISEYFSGVLEAFYHGKKINNEQLDHCVEEVCNLLDLPLPPNFGGNHVQKL